MTDEDKKKKEKTRVTGPPGVPTPPKPPGASTSKKESGKVKYAKKEAATKKSHQPSSDTAEQVKKLGSELSKQKGIFKKNAFRAINPDGSAAYWAAKKAFDAADRRIKEIEKKIARLLTESDPNKPRGIQSTPSQSKVKL